MTQRTIMLIDGSSLAYRAFYSILNIERFQNRAGLHTNALFSFNRMLDNLLEEFKPSHILVAFDKSETTFRNAKYKDYKVGRQKTPSEFKEQMPYFPILLDAYGIKHYDLLDYEADDIIGTLAAKAEEEDKVVIISGDKDLTQLATDNTTVYITRKGVSEIEAYTPESIKEALGITPEQIIDMKGLMGDSSDNYPGITRVGEKTALKLLHQFGSVEEMYERLDELKASKMKENIINDQDLAFLSKDLARIVTDAPLEIELEDINFTGKNVDLLTEFYRQMDFTSFLTNIQAEQKDTTAVTQAAEALPEYTIQVFNDSSDIKAEHLPEQAAYYTEMLETNYHFGEVEAVAWSDLEKEKVYIASAETAFNSTLFKEWLADEEKEKIYLDYKREAVIASRFGARTKGTAMDISIANYLIDTHNAQELADIAKNLEVPITVLYDEAVYGKGAKRAVPEDKESFHTHLMSKLQTMALVRKPLEDRLVELSMKDLYLEMEVPLANILAEMEILGIKVDHETLEEKNQQVLKRLGEMEEEIHALAGEEFNINSPKQLGEILFDRLGLPVIKKTKTGYSTAADVLDKLLDKHPIIQAILDYRQIAKLQSTYLAGLPPYVKEDGKIHTRFVQTLTQTGRLSSADPNLQNIPIRIEEGRKIRQAFIPSHEEWKLVGADYSQIELRVLAHISGDKHMQEAFIRGEDIHSATARRVFGLSEEEAVSSDYRRQAKAVNFGIVYGISDYGLSQNLNITRKEAKTFIDRYFEEYPGIAVFMENIVKEAKENGYVSTLFNRRRYLPDIDSKNFNIRSFAERTAINSPIQGTAADIIKLAMVNLTQALEEEKLEARLVLQVHDELILEAPEAEIDRLTKLVPQIMENATELAVPLKVDLITGKNWYELS